MPQQQESSLVGLEIFKRDKNGMTKNPSLMDKIKIMWSTSPIVLHTNRGSDTCITRNTLYGTFSLHL
jgi:hypothetical protein